VGEDCNKGINKPNGVFGGVTVQLVIRSGQATNIVQYFSIENIT
jgi:hypothetical protein